MEFSAQSESFVDKRRRSTWIDHVELVLPTNPIAERIRSQEASLRRPRSGPVFNPGEVIEEKVRFVISKLFPTTDCRSVIFRQPDIVGWSAGHTHETEIDIIVGTAENPVRFFEVKYRTGSSHESFKNIVREGVAQVLTKGALLLDLNPNIQGALIYVLAASSEVKYVPERTQFIKIEQTDPLGLVHSLQRQFAALPSQPHPPPLFYFREGDLNKVAEILGYQKKVEAKPIKKNSSSKQSVHVPIEHLHDLRQEHFDLDFRNLALSVRVNIGL